MVKTKTVYKYNWFIKLEKLTYRCLSQGLRYLSLLFSNLINTLAISLRSIAGTKKACLRQASHWWRGEDLNFRPSGYEPDELPDCSTPRCIHSIHLNGFFFLFFRILGILIDLLLQFELLQVIVWSCPLYLEFLIQKSILVVLKCVDPQIV